MSHNHTQRYAKPALIRRPPQQHGFWLTEQEYNNLRNDLTQEAVQQSIMKVLLVTVYILWNNWGQLQKRSTRLKIFYDLYTTYLGQTKEPTEELKAVEDEFYKQTELRFER